MSLYALIVMMSRISPVRIVMRYIIWMILNHVVIVTICGVPLVGIGAITFRAVSMTYLCAVIAMFTMPIVAVMRMTTPMSHGIAPVIRQQTRFSLPRQARRFKRSDRSA